MTRKCSYAFSRGEKGWRGVKNWADGTIYSVFWLPSLDRITVRATAYAVTQTGLYYQKQDFFLTLSVNKFSYFEKAYNKKSIFLVIKHWLKKV